MIPLLQIAPSKTNAEQLLISPELADVPSTIVARVRAGQPHVPLGVSYDKNERVHNPPMPLLFQWRRRLENRPVGAFTSFGHAQRFLSAFSGISPHFPAWPPPTRRQRIPSRDDRPIRHVDEVTGTATAA